MMTWISYYRPNMYRVSLVGRKTNPIHMKYKFCHFLGYWALFIVKSKNEHSRQNSAIFKNLKKYRIKCWHTYPLRFKLFWLIINNWWIWAIAYLAGFIYLFIYFFKLFLTFSLCDFYIPAGVLPLFFLNNEFRNVRNKQHWCHWASEICSVV